MSKSAGKRIRVLFGMDVDLPTATLLFNAANWALAIGAALVLVGTISVFWMGSVKEHFGDVRIAENESKTAEAHAAAALADERAAAANERAAQANLAAENERVARLELEAKLAPRTLSTDAQQRIAAAISRFAGQGFEFVSYQDDAEVVGLVRQLVFLLARYANWQGHPARGFLMAELEVGVKISYRLDKSADFGPAASALAIALTNEGVSAQAGPDDSLDETFEDRIRIKVGKKP